MKLIFTLSLALVFTPAHAAELSDSLQERLDRSYAASIVQLAMPDACPQLKEDKKFLQGATEQEGKSEVYQRHMALAEDFDKQAQTASSAGTVSSAGILFLGQKGNASPHPLLFVPASISVYQGSDHSAKRDEHRRFALASGESKKILNADTLDKFSTDVAKQTAALFALDKGEENTIKAAVKAEVARKLKQKDEGPINYFSVLRKAQFKGKPVLSPAKLTVLDSIEGAENNKAPSPKNGDKVAAIAITSRYLEACLESDQGISKSRAEEMKKRISRNFEFLADLAEHAALKSQASKSDAEEPAYKTLDHQSYGEDEPASKE
jgi:hypothetical protein